jgi:RNA polymerase sigma-70 factor, ECF subfamily
MENVSFRQEMSALPDIRQDLIGLMPRLRRFAYALVGDRARSDDLVQEAFVRAFTHLDQFQVGTRLDSWMYKILRNVWLNQERALRVRGTMVDLDHAPEVAGPDGRHVVEVRLTLDQVLRGLAKLPHDQRELIVLVCVEGLSFKDAAAILDIPLGTATSRLARGRRALYLSAVEGRSERVGEHDNVQ